MGRDFTLLYGNACSGYKGAMRRIAWLLVAWLIGAAAWAQAPAAAQVYVDTKDECAALGGSWLRTDSWQAACQTPWPRDDCFRLGGAWTPMSAAPFGGLCMARVSLAAIGRQCTEAGGSWGPPGSAMPWCQPGQRKPPPPRISVDRNRPCENQKDCAFGCIYQGPPVAEGAQVGGRCRATDAPAGCFSLVENGRMAGSICVN